MRDLPVYFALFSAVLTACAGAPVRSDEHGAGAAGANDAAAGVKDPGARALLETHWAYTMEHHPLFATQLGDHRYDDRIGDNSLAWMQDERKMQRQFLEKAKSLLAGGSLNARDKITMQLFAEELEDGIDSEVCAFEEWTVDPRSNPLSWNDLGDLHPVKTVADGKNLVARLKLVPGAIDNERENLSRGAKRQLYGNAESTKRVVTMLKTQLAEKFESWPMGSAAAKEHTDWSPEEAKTFKAEVAAAIETGVKPALERYLQFLESEILPKARSNEQSGLSALPFAKPCYAALVRTFTTLNTTPEAIHATGKSELVRINGEMQKLGKQLFGTDELPKILELLRSDPKLRFTTAEEVEKKAQSSLAAAKAKIGDYFGILPKADCVVTRIPDYEAPYTSIAYYRPPVPDGSKPGQYFINVLAPETRPRYEAEALAFHESIPGHHLQIAIAQELPELPAFRKNGGATAFIEGWGLYAEGLAVEMGLYSSDLDRMGMLSYEAWRASRLVVDTGLHAMGWSRDAAKAYMLEHTALAANNIDNEVDRYINWPGQAVAYKTGQMELWRLRHKAEAELGPKFNIKTFHDVVLKNSAVSLPVLQEQVEAWISSAR